MTPEHTSPDPIKFCLLLQDVLFVPVIPGFKSKHVVIMNGVNVRYNKNPRRQYIYIGVD